MDDDKIKEVFTSLKEPKPDQDCTDPDTGLTVCKSQGICSCAARMSYERNQNAKKIIDVIKEQS